MFQRRFDKFYKQRVRVQHRALELGVILNAYKPRVVFKLYDLHQARVRVSTYGFQTGFFNLLQIFVVELIAVAVALLYGAFAVCRCALLPFLILQL